MERQQLREVISYPLIERYLNEFLPPGYIGNSTAECGTPRSEKFNTLSRILEYYRGGEWHVLDHGREVYQIIERRRIDYDIDAVLLRFVWNVNQLHNERPGYWCGNVCFYEARHALEEAKVWQQRQEKEDARRQKQEEIQAWCQKHEQDVVEEEISTTGYTYTFYLSTVRVLMQKVKVRSKSSISSHEQRAKRALKLARESRWKLSDQSAIEIYDVQGRRIMLDNEK